MRDRLIEQIKMSVPPSVGEWAEVIADNIISDGWMKPTVNVGQTVYAVDRRSELWWKGTIHSICYTINGIDCGVLFDDGEIAIYSQDCVFTNREDAEKALRGDDGK